MTRKLFQWFDERLGAASFARKTLRKVFPDHWSFLIGEIALYSFIILVITGTFLTFYYVPSATTVVYHGPYRPLDGQQMSEAFASVMRISFQVKLGLLFRQIHHWAALVMVGAVALHAARVFFTGAFRKPRDLNWVLGVVLLTLTIGIGVFGYSLPDDLLSGTGLRVIYSIVLSIPVVGTWLAFLVFGGAYPPPDLLERLFVLHVMILPGAIAAVLGLHLAMVWRQKHSNYPGKGLNDGLIRGERAWPRYAFKATGLFVAVFAVLALLAGVFQINPVWVYGPYSGYIASSGAQPDWYAGWLEGLVRLFPAWEFRGFGYEIAEPFFPGLLLPGVFFTIMGLWPWIERRFTRDQRIHNVLQYPREVPLRTAIGVGAIAVVVMLSIAGGSDVLASYLGLNIESATKVMRALVIVVPLLAFAVAYLIARELKQSGVHPVRRSSMLTVRRAPSGGFVYEEVERGGFKSVEERLEEAHEAAGGAAGGAGGGTDLEEQHA